MRDGLPNPDFQLSYEAITDKLPVLEACIKVSCAHGGAWSQLARRPACGAGGASGQPRRWSPGAQRGSRLVYGLVLHAGLRGAQR